LSQNHTADKSGKKYKNIFIELKMVLQIKPSLITTQAYYKKKGGSKGFNQ
jgi:hypothetical protein